MTSTTLDGARQVGTAERRRGGGLAAEFLADVAEPVRARFAASPNNHAVCGYLRTRAVRSAVAALVPVQA
ncbi:MAG TPA: hypothetical protein VLK57_13455 [Pseudonocardia sp.]|jgi:hypothetical protein|nr:hypothetical protein [Pseudonocardia sp.]